jgi:hypothetical protein
VLLFSQVGFNRHEDICESLELFAAEVMPEFVERDGPARERKLDRLGPAMERALARRPPSRSPVPTA